MSKTLAALDWATGPIPSALAMGLAVLIAGWWKGLDGGLIALLAFAFVPLTTSLSWMRRQEEKKMAEVARDSRAARRSLISFAQCAIAMSVTFTVIELFWPGNGFLAPIVCCVAMMFVVGYGVLVGEVVRLVRRFVRRAE